MKITTITIGHYPRFIGYNAQEITLEELKLLPNANSQPIRNPWFGTYTDILSNNSNGFFIMKVTTLPDKGPVVFDHLVSVHDNGRKWLSISALRRRDCHGNLLGQIPKHLAELGCVSDYELAIAMLGRGFYASSKEEGVIEAGVFKSLTDNEIIIKEFPDLSED